MFGRRVFASAASAALGATSRHAIILSVAPTLKPCLAWCGGPGGPAAEGYVQDVPAVWQDNPLKDSRPNLPLKRIEEHRAKCADPNCSRCFFDDGFHGRLRRGAKKPTSDEDPAFAWRNKCIFRHTTSQHLHTWLLERPVSWGGPWAIGCWVCLHYGDKHRETFANLTVASKHMLQIARLESHEKKDAHLLAVAAMNRALNPPADDREETHGVVSGVSQTCPRLDTWVHVLGTLACHGSFADNARRSNVGSALLAGGDNSRRVAHQIITAAAQPLHEEDRAAMREAHASSIAVDEMDGVIPVYTRILNKHGLYDCFLGLAKDGATRDYKEASTCRGIIEQIVRAAAIRRRGRRSQNGTGVNDEVDDVALESYCLSVRSAVADGGPVEQEALFHLSPAALTYGCSAPVFFPNLTTISRDKSHSARSVLRGFWRNLDTPIVGVLESLVTGDRSYCKMSELRRIMVLRFCIT